MSCTPSDFLSQSIIAMVASAKKDLGITWNIYDVRALLEIAKSNRVALKQFLEQNYDLIAQSDATY